MATGWWAGSSTKALWGRDHQSRFRALGEAILVLYGSGALERFDLNTLERVCLSDSPLIKCYHLNPSYPKFVAIARADSALLTQIKTKSSRIYQVRRSFGASIVQPHAIFFDNVKLVTFFEDDTIQIWCAASGRPIRKIALSNYIPRRLASNGGRPSQLVAANSTRLLFATGKHVVVIGVGSESAHLASKPKNSGRRKVKAHADVKHAVRETLQDLEDEANAKASAYSKLQSLQGLSGLTEEEVLQYALALSREDAHPKSELGASDSEGLDGFSALDLTEEEALNYAVFLSRESQH
ncbi:hypothetical protein L0F63_001294 [Massospora cicadina]|nr:hypothetical protein L0F63_001294 [Massospora cicadina]